MPAVLVTRAEPGATATAERLAARGLTPIVAPLLAVETLRDAHLGLEGVQAVLLTSANGARAFAEIAGRTGLPALCPGEATARAAREAGFSNVRSAGGDAADLVELARLSLDPDDGAVLWAGGAEAARDVAAAMREAGFDARRAVIYDAVQARALPPAAAEALESGALAAAMFHSARAASAFVALVRDAGLEGRVKRIAAACMSPRVMAALEGLEFGRVETAVRPHESALMDALDQALDTTSP